MDRTGLYFMVIIILLLGPCKTNDDIRTINTKLAEIETKIDIISQTK